MILSTALRSELAVSEVRGASANFVPFLESILWGTEGARYRLRDYDATLQHLPDPLYLTLKKDNRLIGLRMILEKTAQTPEGPLHCFYHSLFSVDKTEKGKGYGKYLAGAMLDRLKPTLGERGLIYSHVEVDNRSSVRIHETMGYERIGNFSVMSFNRLFPQASKAVMRLKAEQKPEALAALQKQYAGHALTDFDLSLSVDDYYVLVRDGRLVAGVQALPQRWTIESLAGVGGLIALKALPYIPVVRDVFNPKDFRFLKFGNIFYSEGSADAAFELWQGVLALHGLKTAMLFLDKSSPVTQTLLKSGSLGFLNALTETPVMIFGFFQGFTATDIAEFRRRPKVISPVDI